jgi:hypothetical protein
MATAKWHTNGAPRQERVKRKSRNLLYKAYIGMQFLLLGTPQPQCNMRGFIVGDVHGTLLLFAFDAIS